MGKHIQLAMLLTQRRRVLQCITSNMRTDAGSSQKKVSETITEAKYAENINGDQMLLYVNTKVRQSDHENATAAVARKAVYIFMISSCILLTKSLIHT